MRGTYAALDAIKSRERAQEAALDMMSGAVGLIASERRRQRAKGYDDEHDRSHDAGELAMLAGALIMDDFDHEAILEFVMELGTPWMKEMYAKKRERLESLIVAGALIAAEIDRLQSTQQIVEPERSER